MSEERHCFNRQTYCTLHDCDCRCDGCLPHSAPHIVELRALRAELAAANRELERHRHGNTIEGDDVCPDSLALTAARSDLTRLTRERDEAVAELIQVNRVFESIAGEADDLEDALIHSNAMSAGWKRLAKERKIPAFVEAMCLDASRVVLEVRTATIRECGAIAQDIADVHGAAYENADSSTDPETHAYHDGAEDGANKCRADILSMLPDAEKGDP
jgi:hypothetical protein